MKTITCLLAISSIALTGCVGTVKHRAEFSPSYALKPDTQVAVEAVSNDTGKSFDFDIAEELKKQLNLQLAREGLQWASASGGEPLHLSAKILHYEKGNAFGRWLWPGVGSTVLEVEGELMTRGNSEKVAKVKALRTVDMGGAYSIGQWKIVFESVARDIAQELKKQLRRK